MSWPQYVAGFMIFINLAITGCLHGAPRQGKFNIGTAIISAGIWIFILWKGGFFHE